MYYDPPLFRPPSEARSLIIQITYGCSHNKCTFCSMYKSKNFRIRPLEEVYRELDAYPYDARRIFLADGDALIRKTEELLELLDYLYKRFPGLERVSAYTTTQDLLRKTETELQALKDAGLTLLYLGLESGSNEVLEEIKKDITRDDAIEASLKAQRLGFDLSITLISGITNRFRKEHILDSAKMISAIKPKYLSFLTLTLEPGTELYDAYQRGDFIPLTPKEVLDEIEAFITHVDSEGTIFRSNHASNYLALAGVLNKDKEALLEDIKEAKEDEDYRQEIFRSL